MIDQCKISIQKWGGKKEDYQDIHNFIDQAELNLDPIKGRYLLHHSLGPFVAEKKFGLYITNSDNKKIPVKSIVEEHIKAEFNGMIPSTAMWLDAMNFLPWMTGGTKENPNKKVYTQ